MGGERGCWIFGARAPSLLKETPAALGKQPFLTGRVGGFFGGLALFFFFFKLVLPVLLPLMRSINHWEKRKRHRANSSAHGPVWLFYLKTKKGAETGHWRHLPFGIRQGI